MADKKQLGVLADNRRARYDYEILTTYEAGLHLLGSEIKSLRSGRGQIAKAYIKISNGEAWLLNSHISPYANTAAELQHEPLRPRKLLLHRRELNRIESQLNRERFTAVPLRIYLKKHRAKILVGLGRGKRTYERRETLRRKDAEKEMRRAIKKH